jgi:hypothetical protein
MESPRVYSYLRFSDPRQASGGSADRQIEYAAKWAAARNLKLDSSLSLRDEGPISLLRRRADLLLLLPRKEGRTMQKIDAPVTPVELTESNLQLAQENAALHVLLEQSAEFARRQAEAFAAIAEMAHALALNEGLAKDRAFPAATLQTFSEERAAEANTYMGSLAACRALQRCTETAEDEVRSPWPFMASINVH